MNRKITGLVLTAIAIAGLVFWGCSRDNPTAVGPPPAAPTLATPAPAPQEHLPF